MAGMERRWVGQEIRSELAGNLCRCTGYAPIVDSILAAAVALRT